MKLTFRSDTKQRKEFFTGTSFSHPAKISLPLQLWIIENYTKPGDVILDPMAGSGTLMAACTMGRHVVLVELEQKFSRMIAHNWEKVSQRRQLGCDMGGFFNLWGDARDILSAREHPYRDLWLKYPKLDFPTIKSLRRHYNLPLKEGRNLEGLLVDSIISSPPYENSVAEGDAGPLAHASHDPKHKDKRQGYTGKVDSIISSPPYAETTHHSDDPKEIEHLRPGRRARVAGTAGDNPDNIGNLRYGNIDAIVSSPPYEGIIQGEAKSIEKQLEKNSKVKFKGNYTTPGRLASHARLESGYSDAVDNIGNLKATSYLDAMKQVYAQGYKVLKPGGIAVFVVKNFIRDRKEVDLRADTIKLCESVGFTFIEQHERVLTAQSFWRVLYRQRYPDAPEIKLE